MYFATLIILWLILFFLSRRLTKAISSFLHRITKHKKLTVYFMAIFFLPGTLIHELAHIFMAELLFVPTGKMSIIPEILGSEIKMGTAEIGRTDPIRRFLIGVAPFIFGNIIIFSTVYLTFKNNLISNTFLVILLSYIIFQISNTMFSSKKDMEGAVQLFAILAIILLIVLLAGIRIDTGQFSILSDIEILFQKVSLYLLIPVIFDSIILIILKIINR